jgi:hypothetical protein
MGADLQCGGAWLDPESLQPFGFVASKQLSN